MADSTTWCPQCLPQCFTSRGCLHGTNHKFCRLCSSKSCLSSSQVFVWSKISPLGLVHQSEWLPSDYWFSGFQGWYLSLYSNEESWYCYLFVYIDDILLTGNNSALIHRLITLPGLEFKLCDLGNAYYFLGVEVTPTSVELMWSQHKYVLDILCHAGMSSCKLVDTPASISKLDLSSTMLFSDLTRFR